MSRNYWSKSYILCGQTYICTTQFRFLVSNSYTILQSSHRRRRQWYERTRTFTISEGKDEKKQRADFESEKRINVQENSPSHPIQSYRLNSNVARYHRIQISFELLCTVRTYVCYVLPCILTYVYAYFHTKTVTSAHFLFFIFNFIYVSYI